MCVCVSVCMCVCVCVCLLCTNGELYWNITDNSAVRSYPLQFIFFRKKNSLNIRIFLGNPFYAKFLELKMN